MYLANRLADYAAKLRYEQLDEATVHEVRRRLIDSLACALGAYDAGARRSRGASRRRVDCQPGASFLGGRNKTEPRFGRVLLTASCFATSTTTTRISRSSRPTPATTSPPCWLRPKSAGKSGRELITAAVLAYEIQCRLCDAASIRKHGWDHVTYGAFSTAAAAAGKLLGSTRTKSRRPSTWPERRTSRLRQTRAGELSEWKGCAFANASRNGVFAALLAAEGLTGPAPIFEGEMGFFKQVSGPLTLPKLGGEAGGSDFMIKKTSIKFWPAEYHSQSAIHAALELRKRIPDR